mmetsp:Transcript_10634/g.19266  ORF Transcript_10634/g.19266 Transcript_10634/m.19266 type:complete len:434 (-) Transcript_10634:553-1854(-)
MRGMRRHESDKSYGYRRIFPNRQHIHASGRHRRFDSENVLDHCRASRRKGSRVGAKRSRCALGPLVLVELKLGNSLAGRYVVPRHVPIVKRRCPAGSSRRGATGPCRPSTAPPRRRAATVAVSVLRRRVPVSKTDGGHLGAGVARERVELHEPAALPAAAAPTGELVKDHSHPRRRGGLGHALQSGRRPALDGLVYVESRARLVRQVSHPSIANPVDEQLQRRGPHARLRTLRQQDNLLLQLDHVQADFALEGLALRVFHPHQHHQAGRHRDGRKHDREHSHDGRERHSAAQAHDDIPAHLGRPCHAVLARLDLCEILHSTLVCPAAAASGAPNVRRLQHLAPCFHVIIHRDGKRAETDAEHVAEDDMNGEQNGLLLVRRPHAQASDREGSQPIRDRDFSHAVVVAIPDEVVHNWKHAGGEDSQAARDLGQGA